MIRRIHLPLFFLSLAIAVVIKVGVHEAVQLSEQSYKARVRYNLAPTVTVLEPVNEVEVRLRGERSELSRLNPLSVEVEVTLGEKELGFVEITEDRLDVQAPGDLDVVSITPNHFTLEVESKETRTVPVRAVLTGEPAAGAFPGEPVVRPSTAEVVGPRSRVRALRELTAPISLNGHALTFEEEVTVVSPDPLVRVGNPRQVVVFVPMTVPGLESPLGEQLEEPKTP